MVDLDSSDEKTLGSLMQFALESAEDLGTGELAAAFADLLSCPVAIEGNKASSEELGSFNTIGELLRHPDPPIDALKRVKTYAQECRAKAETGIPPAVATAVYYQCIGVAFRRHGVFITSLAPSQLHDGFRWCLQQPWLPEDLKDLIARAHDSLKE